MHTDKAADPLKSKTTDRWSRLNTYTIWYVYSIVQKEIGVWVQKLSLHDSLLISSFLLNLCVLSCCLLLCVEFYMLRQVILYKFWVYIAS